QAAHQGATDGRLAAELPGCRGVSERLLQTLRPGHRGGLASVDVRRPAAVRADSPGSVRTVALHVRLRLARVRTRRHLRAGACRAAGRPRFPERIRASPDLWRHRPMFLQSLPVTGLTTPDPNTPTVRIPRGPRRTPPAAATRRHRLPPRPVRGHSRSAQG